MTTLLLLLILVAHQLPLFSVYSIVINLLAHNHFNDCFPDYSISQLSSRGRCVTRGQWMAVTYFETVG